VLIRCDVDARTFADEMGKPEKFAQMGR